MKNQAFVFKCQPYHNFVVIASTETRAKNKFQKFLDNSGAEENLADFEIEYAEVI